jgi:hypothetical protein
MKLLAQIEKELMDGTRCLKSGLDELQHIVMTPMRPVNSVPMEEDVALKFIRVVDCGELILLFLFSLLNILLKT